MTTKPTLDPTQFVSAIRQSGLSIYEPIEIGHPNLWIPTPELQTLLDDGLRGISLSGLALRTRSKVVKEGICRVLGYPVPRSFKKCQPRFMGQMFDIYTQKSNNLQVWNEKLSAIRRYVLIRISDSDIITRVKVVTGDTLALLDTTGTLTQKYQARCIPNSEASELITPIDTSVLAPFVARTLDLKHIATPINHPTAGELLPIDIVFERLSSLIGSTFMDAGSDQERNRGAALHRLVCSTLGYSSYQDDRQFPDVRHQLIEVKLQTSPTVDLGLVRPNSVEPLDVPMIQGIQIRHCDVRYAIFYAEISGSVVRLTHFFLTTGEAFFNRFPQFGGKVLNAKLQIPLPSNFFDT
ncbi:MAG: restriction endonuclease [Chitinophagaceae bacterium]|nr:restriction endonuclease [Anaerolineae bacterium]